MYLKTENLTLVLIFDRLEHFRCFCRHGRAGAPRDGRHDRLPAHAGSDARADPGAGL